MHEVTIFHGPDRDSSTTIRVGDYVGFKSDIEQSGQVKEIRQRRGLNRGYDLVLTSEHGFEGHYIGGQTETTVPLEDVWLD